MQRAPIAALRARLTSTLADQMDTAAQQDRQQYLKQYDCLPINPCTIKHLLLRQACIMRLRARNEVSFGEFSEEICMLIRANMLQIHKILDAQNIRHQPQHLALLNRAGARLIAEQFVERQDRG